jgi:hypothetical protein
MNTKEFKYEKNYSQNNTMMKKTFYLLQVQ